MKIPITFFAPAEREPLEVVHRQADSFNQSQLTQVLLNERQNYVLLLNAQRQVVMASENILELMPGKTIDQILGLRPGEALGCIHAQECESGCGTSQFCRQCGAVRVILRGLDGFREVQECRLTRMIKGRRGVLHLRVLATPVLHSGGRYTLLTITHIGGKSP